MFFRGERPKMRSLIIGILCGLLLVVIAVMVLSKQCTIMLQPNPVVLQPFTDWDTAKSFIGEYKTVCGPCRKHLLRFFQQWTADFPTCRTTIPTPRSTHGRDMESKS